MKCILQPGKYPVMDQDEKMRLFIPWVGEISSKSGNYAVVRVDFGGEYIKLIVDLEHQDIELIKSFEL